MIKKFVLIIAVLSLALSVSHAQNIQKLQKEILDSAQIYLQQEEFYQAYKRFFAAKELGADIKTCEQGIKKAIDGIEKQKAKAEAALARADEMQRKMETDIFDKAVKERNKEWKGYENYNWYNNNEDEKKAILLKIDSLNLSNNALLRIPREVSECKNLKHLNLLDKPDINWKQSDSTLMQLTEQTALFVSVYDLDSLPQAHWHKIKGIDLRKSIIGNKENGNKIYQPFSEIPQNLLAQQQLTWLKINGENWDYRNTFTQIPHELFTMQHLQHLELRYGSIDTLPAEIGDLRNLTELSLSNNQLTNINAVKSLENLEELYLWGNPITNLPLEIAQFKNLKFLYLEDFSELKIPTENMTEFIKAVPKKVQLSEKKRRNEDNSILLINVSPIAEEWKTLPNVEVVE